jgi:signal transduction histidine kinase
MNTINKRAELPWMPSVQNSQFSLSPLFQNALPENKLKIAEEILQAIATDSSNAVWIEEADTFAPLYVSPKYVDLLGSGPVTREMWLNAVHPDDRERIHPLFATRPTRSFNEEYRLTSPDGTIRWIRERFLPLSALPEGRWITIRITEEVSEQKRLESLILEISGREQARMGQDLHDGICQTLIALKYFTKALESKLAVGGSRKEANDLVEMGRLIGQALSQADVLAKGLCLVEIEEGGFVAAFRELASNVMKVHNISCTLRWPQEPFRIDDKFTSIHLYRIAQEAIQNAVKHGKCRHIVIEFFQAGERTVMTVKDDGVGFSETPHRKGLGLYLLQIRARKIGAALSVKRNPEGGTLVTCSFLQRETQLQFGRRREDQIVH